ncbi:DUF3466 family protein [Ferrimonas balearica]|uniref:DUF3466 family protein n=1 Tax=Ferrimonas balearica TaxID=44012 RepID=UPI001C9A21EE|nr:DUF3466 family protein [Ferrimonas balearica]MBY5920435.1 DUF3466 family protein [Ferrimonas balearica]MBY5996880.1 DUF3466 family protein [Ferrimonas balearica]
MSQTMFATRKVAFAVSAALTLSATGAHAQEQESNWPAYEIVNLNEVFSVRGTLDNTRNGYGAAVSGDVALGIAKGVNDATSSEDDNVLDDVVDAILPEESVSSNSIFRPFIGNNFLFEQSAATGWEPTYVPLLENKPPLLNPDEDEDADAIPRTNAFYFGASALGLRVGSTSALQEAPVDNPNCEVTETSTCSEFYYYRSFESHGFVQSGDNYVLLPPAPESTVYVTEDEELDPTPINVGGNSVSSSINDNGFVVGYASTAISDASKESIDGCLKSLAETDGDNEPLPIDICVQNMQNSGAMFYQTRGYVWQLDPSNLDIISQQALPMNFVPEELPTESDRDNVFLAQALGASDTSDTYIVGRANQLNKSSRPLSTLYAQAWRANGGGYDPYLIGPTVEDSERIEQSIAYDVNDQGMAVGVVRRWVDGYVRNKFAVVDLSAEPEEYRDGQRFMFTEPNDFFDGQSDLASIARSVNNQGIVVGNIEVDRVKNLPRRVRGFAYNIAEDDFININELLTCQSRAYIPFDEANDGTVEIDAEGNKWNRVVIEDTENFSAPIKYEAEVIVVDANQISDDGTIVATALVKLPRVKTEQITEVGDDGKTYIRTVVVTENGKPVIENDANGKPTTNQVPRSLVLKPVDAAQICSLTIEDGLNPPPNERQGASFGWLALMALAPLAWWRRRKG